LKDCPAGYYADEKTRACIKCEHPCEECTAPGTNGNCTDCVAEYGLRKGHCYKPCEDGFYHDKGICKPCHAQCKTCHGPNEDDCESCKDKLYLTDKHTCKPECPTGNYEDDKTKTCEKCHASCCDC